MKRKKFRSLFILIFFISAAFSAIAGDPYIHSYTLKLFWNYEDENTVRTTIKNDYGFQAADYIIAYTFQRLTADLNWEDEYVWSQEGITIEPNSETVFEPMLEWQPDMLGLYRVLISSFSPDDINPNNNDAEKEFYSTSFQNIKFKQADMINPFMVDNSTMGKIGLKLPAREESLGVSFLNVKAKYLTSEKWIVRNLPISPFDETHRMDYYFDWSALGYTAGVDIPEVDFAIKETEEPLTEAFDPYSWFNIPVINFVYDVPVNSGPKKDTMIAEIPKDPSPVVYDSFPGYENYYIGCKMPNIGLDSSKNKATEEYAGDWNACGPAAAANSIQWLEETHPDITATGSSHRDKLMEISKFMERGKEEGVTTRQLVRGKLAYIDEHKLPIHVKFQSWWENGESISSPNNEYGHFAENKSDSVGKQVPPTWEFLKSEIKKGEDVEVLFGWYDHDANRHGGHWVVLSGFFDSEAMKGIYIKDDVKQSDSTSMREAFVEWNQVDEWGRLEGFNGPNNRCWVESVVSESYDPEITFGEEPSHIGNDTENILSELKITNNPGQQGYQTQIEFTVQRTEKLQVLVYSMKGSLVYSKQLGTFQSGTHQVVLPTGSLAEGKYIVSLNAGETRLSAQFVIF